jgi:hypothetical protein
MANDNLYSKEAKGDSKFFFRGESFGERESFYFIVDILSRVV